MNEASMMKTASERLAEAESALAADPLNEELQAMRSVARILEKLPGDTQSRVVAWLTSRYAQARFEGPLGIGRLSTGR